jgi:hypothetical protein
VSTSLTDRRIAGLLVSLALAAGVAAGPAPLTTGGDAAQTHAVQTHA